MKPATPLTETKLELKKLNLSLSLSLCVITEQFFIASIYNTRHTAPDKVQVALYCTLQK